MADNFIVLPKWLFLICAIILMTAEMKDSQLTLL